jgi:hypothetical protein
MLPAMFKGPIYCKQWSILVKLLVTPCVVSATLTVHDVLWQQESNVTAVLLLKCLGAQAVSRLEMHRSGLVRQTGTLTK